jgi:alpha-1,3-mannosyl-glycoprotein beta-1,2-N-acetylglucosaminyltransferase
VKKENIIISQDGAMREIKDVASSFGIKIIQNTEGLRLRGGAAVDGAERIAKHYKYSLTNAFDTFNSPPAPAVIIVEDDLLFSPDFYEYLCSTAPILEKDPSTFVVSAWNDNGFKGKVRDPYTLKRSEYFPGLGWLLPRALYKNELEARWPNAHWDHWLRSPEIHGTREIVYPEVRL